MESTEVTQQRYLEQLAERKRLRRNEWHRRRRLLIAQGRWSPTARLDPSAAREHLEHLRDTYRLSDAALSDLSGIPTRTVFELLQTEPSLRRKWITPDLQGRVLATEFDVALLADLRRIAAAGTVRRLRALMRLGWNLDRLGALLGVTAATVSAILTHQYVTAATARRVAHLYDELSMTQGPSTRGALLAARAGYPPPLAWDDDTIDDPTATPWAEQSNPVADVDEVVVERAIAGHQVELTEAEAEAAQLEGVRQGMSDAQIAEITGRCSRTVLRWRAANGIESRYNEVTYGRAS